MKILKSSIIHFRKPTFLSERLGVRLGGFGGCISWLHARMLILNWLQTLLRDGLHGHGQSPEDARQDARCRATGTAGLPDGGHARILMPWRTWRTWPHNLAENWPTAIWLTVRAQSRRRKRCPGQAFNCATSFMSPGPDKWSGFLGSSPVDWMHPLVSERFVVIICCSAINIY